MLFSRIVASRIPNFESMRNNAIEMTATGIEALTVSPVFSTRYSEDAPKIIPSTVPTTRLRAVNSGIFTEAGMYGSKGTCGWVGLSPTMSGSSGPVFMRALSVCSSPGAPRSFRLFAGVQFRDQLVRAIDLPQRFEDTAGINGHS